LITVASIDHGRQHSHIVGCGPRDITFTGKCRTAKKVAAANDNGHLKILLSDFSNSFGNRLDRFGLNAETTRLTKTLTGKF
jgi:hypothetical protein